MVSCEEMKWMRASYGSVNELCFSMTAKGELWRSGMDESRLAAHNLKFVSMLNVESLNKERLLLVCNYTLF